MGYRNQNRIAPYRRAAFAQRQAQWHRPMAQRRRAEKTRRAPRSWQGLKGPALTVLALMVTTGFLVGASYLLVSGYQQVLKLRYFHLKGPASVQIVGAQRLNYDVVTALTGLRPGLSLLETDPRRLEQTLRQHPWVARVQVARLWPDRLQIGITEYQPLAIVQLDTLYFISTAGVLFKVLEPEDQHDLPILTGMRPEHFAPAGNRPSPLVSKVLDLCQFLKNTGAPFHFDNIAEIHVDSERGLTIYANHLKVAVDVGFFDYGQKFANLQRVLPVLQQSGHLPRLEKINLNYPQKVLVSLKANASSTP